MIDGVDIIVTERLNIEVKQKMDSENNLILAENLILLPKLKYFNWKFSKHYNYISKMLLPSTIRKKYIREMNKYERELTEKHIKAWLQVSEKKIDYCLILNELNNTALDYLIRKKVLKKIETLAQNNVNWDIIVIDCCHHSEYHYTVGKELVVPGYVNTISSYMINYKGATKLLNDTFLKNVFHYDEYLSLMMGTHIRVEICELFKTREKLLGFEIW